MGKWTSSSLIVIAMGLNSAVAGAQNLIPPANIGNSPDVVNVPPANGQSPSTQTIDLIGNLITTNTTTSTAANVAAPVANALPALATGTNYDSPQEPGARPASFFTPILHSDIRDVANPSYNKVELAGAATMLMRVMAQSPEKFVGPIDSNGQIDASQGTQIRFFPDGPKGPEGSDTLVTKPDGSQRVEYVITNQNDDTIKNSILGVEIEKANEIRFDEKVGAKIVDLNLILFVRDDSKTTTYTRTDSKGNVSTTTVPYAYYFRRLFVRVDWTQKSDSTRVIVKGVTEPDISLQDTDFEVHVSVLDRKAILLDRKHNIQKTYPIAAGSLEIRAGNDMSYQFTDTPSTDDQGNVNVDADGNPKHWAGVSRNKLAVTTMTGEFPVAYFIKSSVLPTGNDGTNTRSRIWPAYYNGRPFLGLRAVSGKDLYYTEVGMHYQIDSILHRAFVSHGCMRVADKYLYQLDAIVNDGPKDRVQVEVKNTLDSSFDSLEPIMTREDDGYNAMVFTDTPTSNWVSCQSLHLPQQFVVKQEGSCQNPGANGSCSVANFISSGMHTVADSDCLNGVIHINRPVSEVVDYIRGYSTVLPPIPFQSGLQHQPLIAEGAVQEDPQQQQDQGGMTSEGGDNGFNIFNIFGGFGNNNRRQQQQQQQQPVQQQPRQNTAALIRQYAQCVNTQAKYINKYKCQQVQNPQTDIEVFCNKAWDNYNSCMTSYKQLKGQ